MTPKGYAIVAAACVLVLASGCSSLRSGNRGRIRRIAAGNLLVVVGQDAGPGTRLAARELRTWLNRICERYPRTSLAPKGNSQPVSIRIGMGPEETRERMQPGEGAYEIGDSSVDIYGEDRSCGGGGDTVAAVARCRTCRAGTLAAVWAFLENECGVRAIAPGAGNVVLPPSGLLSLRAGRHPVKPPTIRLGIGVPAKIDRAEVALWFARNRVRGEIAPVDEAAAGAILPLSGLPLSAAEEVHRRVRKWLRKRGGDPPGLLYDGSWFSAFQLYSAMRTTREPRVPFARIERDFCSAFGSAAGPVRAYFSFWREHVAGSPAADAKQRREAGWGDPRRGLLRQAPELFNLETFRTAAEILHQSFSDRLSGAPRLRVQQLVLNHDHARMLYLALAEKIQVGRGHNSDDPALPYARRLASFRAGSVPGNAWDLDYISRQEIRLGDLSGTALAEAVNGLEPVEMMTVIWYAPESDDPVPALEAKELREGETPTIRLDRPWNRQASSGRAAKPPRWAVLIADLPDPPPDRQLFLAFRGVCAKLTLYVDGKVAGTHAWKQDGSVSPSFVLRIDPLLKAGEDEHILAIEVNEDAEGLGVWAPVWLFARNVTPGDDKEGAAKDGKSGGKPGNEDPAEKPKSAAPEGG